MTAYGMVGESSNRHQLIGDSYAGFGGGSFYVGGSGEAGPCPECQRHSNYANGRGWGNQAKKNNDEALRMTSRRSKEASAGGGFATD